jgi:hypothetical protein
MELLYQAVQAAAGRLGAGAASTLRNAKEGSSLLPTMISMLLETLSGVKSSCSALHDHTQGCPHALGAPPRPP